MSAIDATPFFDEVFRGDMPDCHIVKSSCNGLYAAAGFDDGRVWILNIEEKILLCVLDAGHGSVRALVWHTQKERELYIGTGAGLLIACTFNADGREVTTKKSKHGIHLSHLAINEVSSVLFVAAGRSIGFVNISEIGFGPLQPIYSGSVIEGDNNIEDLTTVTSMRCFGEILAVGFFGTNGMWLLDIPSAVRTATVEPMSRLSVYGGSAISPNGKVVAFQDLLSGINFYDLGDRHWLDSTGFGKGPTNCERLVNMVFVNEDVVMCGSDQGVIAFWSSGHDGPLASGRLGTDTSVITGLCVRYINEQPHGLAVIQESGTTTMIAIRVQDLLEHSERMESIGPSGTNRAISVSSAGGSVHQREASAFKQIAPRSISKLQQAYEPEKAAKPRTASHSSLTERAKRILKDTTSSTVHPVPSKVSFGGVTSVDQPRGNTPPVLDTGSQPLPVYDTPTTPFIPNAHSSPSPTDPFSGPRTPPPQTSSGLFRPGMNEYRSPKPFGASPSSTSGNSNSLGGTEISPLVARTQQGGTRSIDIKRFPRKTGAFQPVEQGVEGSKTPKAPGHYNRTLDEVPEGTADDSTIVKREANADTQPQHLGDEETTSKLGQAEQKSTMTEEKHPNMAEVSMTKIAGLKLAIGSVVCVCVGAIAVYAMQGYNTLAGPKILGTPHPEEYQQQSAPPIDTRANDGLFKGPCRARIMLAGDCPVNSPLVFDLGTQLREAFYPDATSVSEGPSHQSNQETSDSIVEAGVDAPFPDTKIPSDIAGSSLE